jgi:hypothetical protein
VYDRDRHPFSPSDLKRIAAQVGNIPTENGGYALDILRDIIQDINLGLLRAILSRFGLESLTRVIYYSVAVLIEEGLKWLQAAGDPNLSDDQARFWEMFNDMQGQYNWPTGI